MYYQGADAGRTCIVVSCQPTVGLSGLQAWTVLLLTEQSELITKLLHDATRDNTWRLL